MYPDSFMLIKERIHLINGVSAFLYTITKPRRILLKLECEDILVRFWDFVFRWQIGTAGF